MTEGDDRGRTPDLRLKKLFCKRTGEQIELSEHERCSYCFGRLADIETGRHRAFCDYHEGKDPIHFGFPIDDKRVENG